MEKNYEAHITLSKGMGHIFDCVDSGLTGLAFVV